MCTNQYYPNYGRIYPNTTLTPVVLNALRQSDRQMKRAEYDLKVGAPVYRKYTTGELTDRHDPDGIIADSEVSREISLEMLLESGEKAVINAVDEYANPLAAVLKMERYEKLYRSLAILTPEERRLINALFWKNMTETDYANSIGRRQSSVNKMKHRIFAKAQKKYFRLTR